MRTKSTDGTSSRRRAILARWLPFVPLALCVAACGLGEDRAEYALARAEELLAEDRGNEAIVALRTAAQLRPDDADLSRRVGDVAAAHGHVEVAAEYYADAYALDPTDDEVALSLARLLVLDEPERSAALVDEVLARSPDSAAARLVRAEAMLATGRVPEARRLAEQARHLAPDDPEVYWVMALVHEARVRAIRTRAGGGVQGRESLDAILDAYDTYVEKGGKRRVQAALGRARSTGSWSGLQAEAEAAYRSAVELALAEGTPFEQLQVLRATATYAHAVGATDLERLALEHWVDVTPAAFSVWERLAAVPGPGGAHTSEATFQRMLEANPDHPSAHVVYSRHLADTRGYASAIEHLESRIGQGMDDAVLLTGIVNLQHAHRRPLDAARTLERMQRDYGGRPATALLVARHQLTNNQLDQAVATLRSSIASQETAEAQRLLARTELERQRYDEALVAVERAIELAGTTVPENIRLKARIQMARGENRPAARTLARLQRIEPLTPDDQLMMARAYYDSSGVIQGRRILESMLSGKDPSPEAALELARREMSDSYRRVVVREHLEAVHRRHPDHIEVLKALTEDDLRNDQPLVALARITKSILRRPRDGDLYLARARLMLALERPADAALDARRAIAVSPETRDDAYEMLASLYMNAADPQAPIEAILARDAKGQTTPDDIALLARLVLQTGDEARARELYERALAAGSELALLKNDLAFLLAKSGEDLDRALTLAREAADARGARLAAADTLGFVYLQSGNYEAAFWQFRFVTEEASPPVAEYYYHLGLALMKLERHADARDALAEALRIEPGYAPAASALRELDALRESTRAAASRAS